MFSQLRQAVEGFTPQPRRGSDSSSVDEQLTTRSRSPDAQGIRPMSPLSSGQLAESALLTLRKSLASQRSPSTPPATKSSPTPSESKSKMNLEDRLRRATFAIGELSNVTTPETLSRSSPPPLPKSSVKDHASPASIPLPESPVLSPRADGILNGDITLDVPLNHTATPTNQPPDFLLDDREENLVSTDKQVAESPNEDVDTIDGVCITPSVESLQEQLKQVEQRFSDVSSSFKKLQAEKLAVDTVLREMTSVESIVDADALREYLRSSSHKTEIFQDEVKLLRDQLKRQEDRIEELRDTHRLESASQSAQIEKLRVQLHETEIVFQAARATIGNAEEAAKKREAEFDLLNTELERMKTSVKEEEEKRVKAISLLKTVRQKLVKAEKDKDEALKEAGFLKEKDKGDRDREQSEKARLQHELEVLSIEKEKAVASLKIQHERDTASSKERYEKEIFALKGRLELDVATLKGNHAEELLDQQSEISNLGNSLRNAIREKNNLYDDLQLRQAEIESARAHLESVQNQNTELQFQSREINERLALLKEEYAELQRAQDTQSREPVTLAGDVAQLILTTETKYEAKLTELKRSLAALEKERSEGEMDWSRKLREKSKELDELRRVLGSATKTREEDEEKLSGLKEELSRVRAEAEAFRQQVFELPRALDRIKDVEDAAKSHQNELHTKLVDFQKQFEESKARETQLRQSNKTLREELRKVQSSAALLERQRNPGVGYWTTRANENPANTRTSISSTHSESPSRVGSPTLSTTTSQNEEEVNLEYLRNVILQFLEHKEMRPNLIRVLSIILHFTPQETRRLVAKV